MADRHGHASYREFLFFVVNGITLISDLRYFPH